jgi:hypothetical protein
MAGAVGSAILGLVAETGEMFFDGPGSATSDGVYHVGQFTTTANTADANVAAITKQNSIYPDRGTSGTGTLDCDIVERASLTDCIASITTGPAAIGGGRTWTTGPVSLSFSSQYNRPSSLATIAGNYGATYGQPPGSSLALTISSSGVLFAQDAVTGCVINGTVTTIDPRFNMYGVIMTPMNCAVQFNVPDGSQLKGLATLDNSQTPEYVRIGAADTVSTTKSAMTLTANRM